MVTKEKYLKIIEKKEKNSKKKESIEIKRMINIIIKRIKKEMRKGEKRAYVGCYSSYLYFLKDELNIALRKNFKGFIFDIGSYYIDWNVEEDKENE